MLDPLGGFDVFNFADKHHTTNQDASGWDTESQLSTTDLSRDQGEMDRLGINNSQMFTRQMLPPYFSSTLPNPRCL